MSLTLTKVDHFIKIGPLNYKSLKQAISKRLTPTLLNAFTEIERHRKYLFFHADYIIFDQFFALDFYIIFSKLGNKEAANLIKEHTWVYKLFHYQALPMDYTQVEKVGIKLFDYQKNVLKKYSKVVPALDLRGQFLALEQGLGKTYTSIAIQLARKKDKVLVVCPKSLVDQWIDTLSKLNLKVCAYTPTSDCKWFVTNYERLANRPESFLTGNTGVIIDEVHFLRNITTIRAQKMIELILNHKNLSDILLLTGTPIISNSMEYISYLIMLDPYATIPLLRLWIKIYIKDPKALTLLAKYRFTYYFTRIKKAEVLKLPPKTIKTINVTVPHIKKYELSTILEDVNRQFEKNKNKYLKDFERQKKMVFNKLKEQLTREEYKEFLRVYERNIPEAVNLILNDKTLNLTQEDRTFLRELPVKERNFFLSIYLSLLMKTISARRIEIIQEIIKHNHSLFCKIINQSSKTIIFSSLITALQDSLKTLSNYCKFKYEFIDGTIPQTARTLNIKRFIEDDQIRVLGMSSVGSVGLNLIVADTLIVLNSPWREAELEQIEDRIHRIGQVRPVKIYIINVNSEDLNVHSHMRQIALEVKKYTDRYQKPMGGIQNEIDS